MKKATLEKLYWPEIRSKVLQVNSKLAAVIDQIDPDNHLPLYKVNYPYGSTIVKEGVFYLPNLRGNLVPLNDDTINSSIQKDFTYAGMGLPAGIVLKNNTHEMVTTSNQMLPLGVVTPGSIFALWKKLDTDLSFHPIKMFTITAGARFICMLPNISDVSLHKNLKRDFNVRQPPPKTLLDHWNIFKSIIQYSDANWTSELLFFSEAWFERMRNNSTWHSLHLLLLENAWRKSAYERNLLFYNLAFSRAQANRNLKPNPYLADTTKHLMMIASGTVSGFGVLINETDAPISLIQQAYIDSYGLKEYVPTLFGPQQFSLTSSDPVYYSLAWPTTLEFSPKSRKESSILDNLSEIRHLLLTFLDEIRLHKLKVEDTILGHIASTVGFDFYHSKNDKHGEIKISTDMPKTDARLMFLSQEDKPRQFADSSPFVRGCIKINNRSSCGI